MYYIFIDNQVTVSKKAVLPPEDSYMYNSYIKEMYWNSPTGGLRHCKTKHIPKWVKTLMLLLDI